MKKISPWTLLRGGGSDREAGLRSVRQAFAQQPDASHTMQLGVALLWLELYGEAWEHFRRTIKEFPQKGDAFYGMAGAAKWCLGESTEAVSEWRAGLKAKYARASGLGIRMPLLLFFAAVRQPHAFDKGQAEELIREKLGDIRIRNWPGPIARLVLDQISETEFQNHCLGIKPDDTGKNPFARHSQQETSNCLWLADFYRSILALEQGKSLSDFRRSMLKLSDTSQPDWQDEKTIFTDLVRGVLSRKTRGENRRRCTLMTNGRTQRLGSADTDQPEWRDPDVFLTRIKCQTIVIVGMLVQFPAIADWQIVASNVVSGTAFPSANLVVRKITATTLREDMSSAVSMLFFVPKQEQVVLNHLEKTYVRQNAHPLEEPSAAPFSCTREQSLFQGQPAEAWHWTNGPACGCTWVASSSQFLASMPRPFMNATNAASSRTDMLARLSVGSVFGTNIVVCTELHRAGPVAPVPAGIPAPTQGADVNYTMTSTLLSITQTNFSPSEFEIPSDYTDVTGRPPPAVQIRPEMLGSRMVGQGNMEGLRKQYEAGKPVLEVPKVRTAN